MTRPRGLHHVAVRTVDLDASIRFYREGLCFGEPYVWSYPPYVERAAFLSAGDGTYVELFAGGSAWGREEPTEGQVHFALLFDDVDAAYQQALAAGAESIAPPASFTIQGEPPADVRLAYVLGPSGERIELYRTTLGD